MGKNWLFVLFTVFLSALGSPPLLAKDWPPELLQASKLAYSGNYQEGERVIDQYIQNNPNNPNGYFTKAVVMEWKFNLNAVSDKEYQPQLLAIYKKANDLAFHLWDKDQKNVDKMIDLGNAYLLHGRKLADMGKWFNAVLTAKKCQKHLEEALEKDPSRVDGLWTLGAFHYLGDNAPKGAAAFRGLLGIRGTKAQGLEEMNKALGQQHPFILDNRYLLYVVYKDYEKNTSEASRILASLESDFPLNPEFKYKRAGLRDIQNPGQGIQDHLVFIQWCESNKSNCHDNYLFLAYYHAGRLFKEQGQEDKSLEYFAKALQFDKNLIPDYTARAQYWPGQIEEAKGQYPTALEKYRKAKEVHGISKDLKKEIDGKIDSLCSAGKANVKC